MMNKQIIENIHWILILSASVLAALYWSFLASDRYVSQANIVLDSPKVSTALPSVASLLSGAGGNADLLLLKEHLLSTDMLKKLDEAINLREHYMSSDIDWFSRLGADEPFERFHEYYLNRIEVIYDEYAGVLRVHAEAFDAQTAQRIAQLLLSEGEQHMNLMGQRLAQEQVQFIEKQIEALEARLHTAREAVIEYQNRHGLISPTGEVESISAIVAQMEAQLAALSAKEKALESFQSSASPERIQLQVEMRALKDQIRTEKLKMTQKDNSALNRVSAEYERLSMQAQFALELYSTALSALEATRVEASRQLKKVSVLQAPTLPEYATKPERIYNIAVFFIFGLFAGGIFQLVRTVIRDHRD